MKRSDMIQCFTPDMSRDDLRKKSYSLGLGNIYQETEMDSALVDTHQDISYLADYIEQHSHIFYEIIYCVQGDLKYLLGVHRYLISAGDIIIIPPGVIHSPLLANPLTTPYERYVLWVSPSFANMLREANSTLANFQEAFVLHTSGTKWEYLSRYFSAGVREAERQAPGWEVCLGGNTTQLITHLARAIHDLDTVCATQKEELLEKVLEYIQTNLDSKLSIRTTAQHFHISESTLTHLFHRELKMGFYHCVMQRRLVEAKKLIQKGDSMEQVSLAVGFSEYSAFYRAFKAEYGISPMKYQKMTR